MARTAPAVDGTPDYQTVALRWIDASGDKRSDSNQVPAGATSAQIEAYADAMADASNASLYAVQVTAHYNSTPDKSDAVSDAKSESVFDNLVFLAKTVTNASQRGFTPAPIDAMFVAGTDTIDPSSTELAAIFTAFLAMVGAGYSIVSARYTERREINEAVNI